MSKNRNNNQNSSQETTEEVETSKDKQEITQSDVADLGDVLILSTKESPKDKIVVITTQPPVDEKPEEKKEALIDTKADGLQLNSFQTRVAWLKENGTTREKHVITVLENYVHVCTTSVELEKIAIEQQRLWRLFEYIHVEPMEFRKLFTIVVEFAKEYRESAFDMSMFFRAQSSLNMAGNRLIAFNNIRTLLVNTANSVDNKQVKSIIDIRKIIEIDAIPEHIRAQYVAFYN